MSISLKDKDSVFADAADEVSEFDTIFGDEEDSIIEAVEGYTENGESLIGNDEELSTDNDDDKVDIEDSSSDTLQIPEKDGTEIKESMDLDELFGVDEADEEQTDETDPKDIIADTDDAKPEEFHNEAENIEGEKPICPACGNNPCTCKAPKEVDLDVFFGVNDGEQTDETDPKDIIADDDAEAKEFHNEGVDLDELFGVDEAEEEQTDETDTKDIIADVDDVKPEEFHNEGADLDKLFAAMEAEEGDAPIPDLEDDEDDEDIDESLKIDNYERFDWFDEAEGENSEEDYAEDELIDAAVEADPAANMDLEYEPGEDDKLIDDVIADKE